MSFSKEQQRQYLERMYKKAGFDPTYKPVKVKPVTTGFVDVTYITKFETKTVNL